jgi:hypothetical protein
MAAPLATTHEWKSDISISETPVTGVEGAVNIDRGVELAVVSPVAAIPKKFPPQHFASPVVNVAQNVKYFPSTD